MLIKYKSHHQQQQQQMPPLCNAPPVRRWRDCLPASGKALAHRGLKFLQHKMFAPVKLRYGAMRLLIHNQDNQLARWRVHNGREPLSYFWGYERGEIINRYYTKKFLSEFAGDIGGRTLEFQADDYSSRFGKNAITKLDILHLDATNKRATIIADLTQPNDVPSNTFDCIICTYVLHLICDAEQAVRELYRVLRPGGVLLIAVPHLSMEGKPVWREFWRYTPDGLSALLSKTFDCSKVTMRAYGNSLTAAGEIRGMVADEFSVDELDFHDARFALTVCARAVK